MPFDSAKEALANERKASANCLLLSGIWKFDWAPVSVKAPEQFFEEGLDASGWADIEVPGSWEMQSAQPVGVEAVDLAAGRIRVTNRHHFTDLSELETRWRVTADERVVQEGRLDLAVPPGESAVVAVPFQAKPPQRGVEHRLDVSFVLPRATAWAPAGHEVAWEQLDLPRTLAPAAALSPSPLPPLQMEQGGGRVVVRGRGFDCTFDEKTGTLSSLRFGGTELLAQGPRANVWRAPLANERDAWGVFRGRLATHREGMGDDIANGWRSIGLDRLEHTVTRFSARQVSEGEVVVEVRALATSPVVPATAFASGFELEYLYRVLGTGEIVLRHSLVPQGRMPQWLPKVGLQMASRRGWRRSPGPAGGRTRPTPTARRAPASASTRSRSRTRTSPTSSPRTTATRPTCAGRRCGARTESASSSRATSS
jgi:beta-galactosidase